MKLELTYTKNQKKKPVDKMLGADISFLPQLEARGIKFSDGGVQKDQNIDRADRCRGYS